MYVDELWIVVEKNRVDTKSLIELDEWHAKINEMYNVWHDELVASVHVVEVLEVEYFAIVETSHFVLFRRLLLLLTIL